MLTSPCLSVESLFGPGAKAKELAVCSWSSAVTGAQGAVSGASVFSRPRPDNQITTLIWSDNSEHLVGRGNRYGVSWAQTHSFPRSKPTSGTIVPWLWTTGLSSATYLLKWSSATRCTYSWILKNWGLRKYREEMEVLVRILILWKYLFLI